MPRQVQLRRGTTAEHASFTGAQGEITVDTDLKTVVVHDGATAGGFPLQKAASTLTASAALNFDLSAVTYQDLTIACPGAVVGDVVALGIANAAIANGVGFVAWVSAAGVVTVRAFTVTGTPNPASGTFTVKVLQ